MRFELIVFSPKVKNQTAKAINHDHGSNCRILGDGYWNRVREYRQVWQDVELTEHCPAIAGNSQARNQC